MRDRPYSLTDTGWAAYLLLQAQDENCMWSQLSRGVDFDTLEEAQEFARNFIYQETGEDVCHFYLDWIGEKRDYRKVIDATI